ncbi:NAD(P)H-binding protein [Corynebacterium breve]|uniref:NAD(P)H-binding protein n=1 Tax=Corynebacterium breve TaxID=3049799 RepID=A0ABY8VIR9_9CORY|nr:NAD(P)H-binding protein [Corynebacterium breve]WIM68871.1 NAD(P)H-binding protein [Corynebacterium breve]
MDNHSKKVLIIGGRGKVARLATEMLVEANASVTSLVRTVESVAEVEVLGASALVRDLTEISLDEWTEILADYDAVVWAAGNGGRGGADVTYAVDRDGAIEVIDALATLEFPPRFIMVSYIGSLETTATDDGGTWYAYVEAKKAADQHLLATEIEYIILAPSALTDDPARGIALVENTPAGADGVKTSRELVAEMVAEMVLRATLPEEDFIAFVDGDEEILAVL